MQTLHHTLRVLKINRPHAAIIEFVGASDLNSVRAVLLSCCSLIRSIDESERCDLCLQRTRVIPYLNSDINFLDSKSLIINFLGQDFESYMLQTTVNADCSLFEPAVRSFLILSVISNPPIAIFVISAHLYSPLSFDDAFSFTSNFYLNFVDTVELLCLEAARNCTKKF